MRKQVPRTSEKVRRARHEKALHEAVKLVPASKVVKKPKPIRKTASVKVTKSKTKTPSPPDILDVPLPKVSPMKKRLSLPKKYNQSLEIERPVVSHEEFDISTKSKQPKIPTVSKSYVENAEQLPISSAPGLPYLVQQGLSIDTLEKNLKPLQEQFASFNASIESIGQNQLSLLQSVSEIRSEVAANTESTSLNLNIIETAIAGLRTSITGTIQTAVDTSIRNLEVSLKFFISQELQKLQHDTMTRQWAAYPFPMQPPVQSPTTSHSHAQTTTTSRTPTKRSQPETPSRVSLQKKSKPRGKLVQSESEDEQDQEDDEEQEDKSTGKQKNIKKLIKLLSSLD